ncbi:hypothetical protein [Jannaschia sp. R86511]|uniref:hypothetical protein n=1 Tax=Jannaschia sp. R86511 TaxID=3093853 RepID=UPI0036D2B814
MIHFALTPGLLADAEVSYRHEQVARDLSGGPRARRWWDLRPRRARAGGDDLTLAA